MLTGFFVGFWLLTWADKWRKVKLMVLKMENCKKLQLVRNAYKSKMEVESIEERVEQKNIRASADSEYEDISGLTVKEIYHLYQGREVLITTGIQAKKGGRYCGRLAGYDNEGSILYIGFPACYVGPYSLDDINAMRNINPEVSYVEPVYKNYDCYIPSLIRIYK